MVDRNTKIRGTQIHDESITPAKIKTVNAPVDGYILEYVASTQEWQGIPSLTGTTEVPTGDINNSNKVFVLSDTPESGTLHVFLNGLAQEEGSGADYVLAGTNITFVDAPQTGDVILVCYLRGSTSGAVGTAVSYKTTFADGDLHVTNKTITITHNLDREHPLIVVYDDSDNIVNPTERTYKTVNTVELDFTGMTPLTGTYKVRVIG
jgi:hypothetical protein